MGTIPRLPTTGLDDINIRRRVRETINELIPVQGTWTAAVRGSGTAGTYEIASQDCSYFRLGNRVWADVGIVMAGTVTGGGTGDLEITGLPFSKRANYWPIGDLALVGINLGSGTWASLAFNDVSPTTDVLRLWESGDNIGGQYTPISGVGANDQIFGSISFEIAS